MNQYAQPHSIAEALTFRAQGNWTVLAGGTDFYPTRADRPIQENVLDISRIQSLKSIEEHTDHFRIGALVTWSQIIHAKLPPYFDALKQAAREVGGVQIQNSGTLVGNICNASPAADGVPVLLALAARVEVHSHAIPAAQIELYSWIISPKKTQISQDALVTALIIPKLYFSATSAFLKTGARAYLLISTVMVAAVLEHKFGRITQARVAVGACSPVAKRLTSLEEKLIGRDFDAAICDQILGTDFAVLTPIGDVRATAAYRLAVARTLTHRALQRCVRASP